MPIDPRLRQGLLASQDLHVKAGGQILDHCCEPSDDRHRECKDIRWALLLPGAAAMLAACAAYKLPGPGEEGQASSSLDASALLLDTGTAAVVAVGGAALFLAVAERFTEQAIWRAVLAVPNLVVVAGLLRGDVYGIIEAVFGLGLTLAVHSVCKGSVPFTALLIRSSISAMQAHRGMHAVSLLGAVLSMAWCLLCISADPGLYAPDGYEWRGWLRWIAEEWEDPTTVILMLLWWVAAFLRSLPLLWGSMVAVNASHVACCGVVGRWYFGRDQGEPVFRSTKAAFVYSFGTVCFASSALPPVRALQFGIGFAIFFEVPSLAFCLDLTARCTGTRDIVEWFNNFALVQCAVRGLGFTDAARAAYALCNFAKCDKICADSLVGCVVASGAVLVSFLSAAAVWLLGGESVTAAAAVSLMVASAMLQPLESCATTLIVCWAESPGVLARRKPELASAFSDLGHNWHGGGGDASFAMQPQPGGVEGAAAAPPRQMPMAEMASRPPRQIAVVVPQGVMPGQQMQFQTPDGRTIEVEVPEGCAPGSQVLAAY